MIDSMIIVVIMVDTIITAIIMIMIVTITIVVIMDNTITTTMIVMDIANPGISISKASQYLLLLHVLTQVIQT